MKKVILINVLLTTLAFAPQTFAETAIKNITESTVQERTLLGRIVRQSADDIDAVEVTIASTDPTMTSHHGFDELVDAFTNKLAFEITHKLLNHPESDARLNTPRTTSQPWWATDKAEELPQQAALLQRFLQLNQLKSDTSLFNILEKSMTVDPGFCDGDTRRQRPQNCEYPKTLIFLPLTNGAHLIKGYRVYWY
jgi:hypothetical protein